MEPDWRTRFLSVITDPSIAYVLILLGIYALVFEFSNPGLVFPGVVGAICVLIALYAFHLLPVNYAGLALMLVGIAFMVGELFSPAYGSLGIGGAIAFVIGSVILIDTGYLFPETYRFVDDLTQRLDLNLKVVRSDASPASASTSKSPDRPRKRWRARRSSPPSPPTSNMRRS